MSAGAGHAASAADVDELPAELSRLLKKHRIPTSAVSLEVRDLNSGQAALSVRAGAPRNPASVIKLLTTLAALELLGPAHRWQTRYLAAGDLTDGVLDGDLIFQGGGDPFISVERFGGQLLALRHRGLRVITGDWVVDNSRFTPLPGRRADFDGRAQRVYNVQPDAALVNFSATRFVLAPRGGEIRVFAEPPLAGLEIVNHLQPGGGKCANRDAGWSYRITRAADSEVDSATVSDFAADSGDFATDSTAADITVHFTGTYPLACGEHSVVRSIVANADYTYRLFAQLWRLMGGALRGRYRIAGATDDAPRAATATPQTLLVWESESLADIITDINKFSNNVMARQLLLNLGAEFRDEGEDSVDDSAAGSAAGSVAGSAAASTGDSTYGSVDDSTNHSTNHSTENSTIDSAQTTPDIVAGRAAIARWLSAYRIAMPAVVIDNGAGLSRRSRASAAGLSALLAAGWRSPYRPEFLASLPLAAIDGTMRKRLRDTSLAGRARVKTGLINGIRAMAGYVHAADGRHYSVAMIIASPRVNFWNGNAAQDALLRWVYGR